MKKRRMVKLLGVLASVIISFNIPGNVFASDVIIYKQEDNERVKKSEVYEWVLKYENGKVYKRLFNVTRGYFVGDWIEIG